MPYKLKEDRQRYQREWIAKRRADYFEGKHCATCRSTERLELDHKDPSKKVSHKIWSWSAARRAVELKKCQILCHWCHLTKTAKDVKKMRRHGTVDCYVRYHCRCDKCIQIKGQIPTELRRYDEYSGNPNEESPPTISEDTERSAYGELGLEAFEPAFA